MVFTALTFAIAEKNIFTYIVGDIIFEIDPDKCVECEGYFDSPQCVDVCPSDAIVKG